MCGWEAASEGVSTFIGRWEAFYLLLEESDFLGACDGREEEGDVLPAHLELLLSLENPTTKERRRVKRGGCRSDLYKPSSTASSLQKT